MSKTAIVIFSDPKYGSEESLGRMFNALVLGSELKKKGEAFEIIFQGTGTRWPEHLEDENHPAHGLYRDLFSHIKGACAGCAEIFGAKESLEEIGMELIQENPFPGTSGVTDMAKYVTEGERFLIF